MPIRIEILTGGPAFPDQGSAGEYIHAVSFVTKQVDDAIKEFAKDRVDRTSPQRRTLRVGRDFEVLTR